MASNEVDTDGAKDGTHDNGSLKLFEMWTTHDVKVTDNLLRKYIQIRNSDDDLPSSNHPYARPVSRFRKTHCPIVELLAGSFLINRNSGNEIKGLRIVDHAFRIINYRTNQNPIQVLVDAIVNCAPRELDSTSAYPLGTVRHQAVGVLPREWVDHAINLLIIGAFELSPFRNVKNEGECLADELINTANGSSSSHALEMRDELERNWFEWTEESDNNEVPFVFPSRCCDSFDFMDTPIPNTRWNYGTFGDFLELRQNWCLGHFHG